LPAVTLWPSGLVTTMGVGPQVCALAGTTQVSAVGDITVTSVAGTPPMVTVAPAAKPLPVRVSVQPPVFTARAGETVVSVGPVARAWSTLGPPRSDSGVLGPLVAQRLQRLPRAKTAKVDRTRSIVVISQTPCGCCSAREGPAAEPPDRDCPCALGL
jgi:hypothetical protein